MIIAATAFWVVLGSVVLFMAFRGSVSAAPGAGGDGGDVGGLRGGARVAVIAVVFALGLIVPVLVSVSNGDHKARTGPAGITLTPGETAGRTLFASKCATCHTLHAAEAVGRVGPNLDVLRPPSPLILDAVMNGRARGMGQMPALLFQGTDAKNVADFVAAVAGH